MKLQSKRLLDRKSQPTLQEVPWFRSMFAQFGLCRTSATQDVHQVRMFPALHVFLEVSFLSLHLALLLLYFVKRMCLKT